MDEYTRYEELEQDIEVLTNYCQLDKRFQGLRQKLLDGYKQIGASIRAQGE